MVRGTVVLPHGVGKTVRVVVFAQGDKAQEALRAGADEVGGEDLVKQIEAGWLEFDVALATPDMMGMVGRLGRILGRRGLMPNPKSGTITFDLERAVREVKAGRVEFKVDKGGIIHVPFGKASFEPDQLIDNLATLVDAVNRARPERCRLRRESVCLHLRRAGARPVPLGSLPGSRSAAVVSSRSFFHPPCTASSTDWRVRSTRRAM